MGCYLTDGRRLFRVTDSLEKHVLLEDCKRPDWPVVFWKVSDVLSELRLVRH